VSRDPSISGIGELGFGVRGFRHQGKLASWIRDPRDSDGDMAKWDHEI
jgi:hypothetical protein